MKITRSQSLALAAAVILLFFMLSIALIRHSSPPAPQRGASAPERSAPAAASPSAAQEDSRFMLDNFRRSEIKNGRKAWEVVAKRGRYSPETQTAQIEEAKVWVYRKDDEVVELTAPHATLFINGNTLDHVDAGGGVKIVHNDQVTITTDTASYDKARNIVIAPGHVTLTSERADIEGDELRADLTSKEVTLARNVTTVIRPVQKDGKKKGS